MRDKDVAQKPKLAPSPEDVRAKPRFQGPDEPPNPILKRAGFNGGIQAFNQHVDSIVNAHKQTFGYDPPAGLTLDIARSGVSITDYPQLFPAVNKRTFNLNKTVSDYAANNPHDVLADRGDGVLARQYPFRPVTTAEDIQATNKVPSLEKRYPNVQMGMLPIPGVDGVYKALRFLDQQGGLDTAVTQAGLTPAQFEEELKRGRGVLPDLAGTVAMGQKLQEQQGATGGQGRTTTIVGAALTLKDAQGQLNKLMGTNLPATGYFNEDWTKALSNWMKSADYFHKVTVFQAKDAGFGGNTNAYLKAWKSKQYSVQHHGLSGHFLNAMPLQVFGHGFAGGLFEVPKYIVGGGSDPVSIGLHSLTRTAGLALGAVGGSVNQAKADLAAGNAFAETVVTHPGSFDDALKHAAVTLKKNPTWLRVFYPDLTEHPNAVVAAIDQLTNITGDLILLGKPRFTGEMVKPGDLAAARTSTYVGRSARWAYDYIQRGNIGRAAEMMEGGQGANQLTAVAAPLVKKGLLTSEQFQGHLAELYATGSTTVMVGEKELTVTGPVLASLRTRYLPTPGTPGAAFLTSKKFTRDWLDAFDASHHTILGSKANAFINTLRTSLEHVTPASMHYFDENLPGSVRHFIVDRGLGDRALADKYASEATRYQATQNVPKLQAIQMKIEKLYHAKYPLSKQGIPGETFQAQLGTEAPSIFAFPAGGEADVQGFARISRQTKRLDEGLNKFAKYRTRLVLSTGFSLFYKHAVGDFMRFVYGGGLKGNARAGVQVDKLARSNPEYERMLGTFLGRSELGETRYVLGRGGSYSVPAFRTGEAFHQTDRMEAAGSHLRRLLTDDALSAYRLSNGTDLEPLTQLVLHNRTYRGMWKAAKQEAAAAEAKRLGVEKLPLAAYKDVLPAEEYAKRVYERFQEIDTAASAAGVPDVWSQGLAVLREHRGAKVDAALGSFVKTHQLDFPVTGAKIEAGGFDEVTGRIISFLMKPNKYYRRRFAENVLHNTFADLTAAGFDEKQAFEVGTNLAGNLVKYHMLDFSNRLQVEQDFRWLSWFATKHRLYWKWVTSALARSPGAAAVIGDVQNALDSKGNLNFEVFGHRLSMPAARLVWVPGKEYAETSPDAQFIWDLVKHEGDLSGALKDAYMNVNGTGNIITRVDQGLRMAARTARIMSGQTPSTFEAASNGLPALDKQRLQKSFNEYTLAYFHAHGHYPTERDVVRHVMWRATADNLWRSTLPLPVVPASPDITDQQKLVREFMLIVDPKARSKFLADHPGFSDHFGVWDDPKAFLHNHQMFGRYNDANNAYHAARTDLYERSKKNGMTPELVLLKRKLDAAYQKTFDKLLIEDARSVRIDVQPGEVPGVGKVPLGPWGKLASADPQINPRHILNALFPNLKSSENDKVYGRLQKELKAELALLNNPVYAATYPDPQELKTRKGIILSQLDVFRRYPTDALGKIQRTYQDRYVNTYWKTLDAKYQHINELPADQRDLAYAELRAWRDSQDREVTVGGVRFPSPIRMAWATLDPQTRNTRLRYFASKNWADLTNYEKDLLGLSRDRNVSKGWQTFLEAYTSVSEQMHLQGNSVPSGYKDVLAKDINKKVAPGFLQDYFFSKKPLYERLPVLSVVKDSKYKAEWHDLLTVATTYGRYLKSSEYSKTSVKATWRAFLKSPGFLDEFNRTPKGFRDEVLDYGPNFLNMLIGGN